MKITHEVKKESKAVGVANPIKVALYDDLAKWLANRLNDEVGHVKPRKYKDEETGKTKSTGGYGLLLNLEGAGLTTLELVIKSDNTTEEDFVIVKITKPGEDNTDEDNTEE